MSDEQNRENEVLEETSQADPGAEVVEEDPGQGQEPEQQPSETETDAEVDKTEESNEVESSQDEPPKDNAAWAKLRTENKQLKQAMEQAGVDAEYLEMLRQANQPQQVDYSRQLADDPDYQDNTYAQMSARALQEVQQLKNQLEFEQDKTAREKFSEYFADPEFEALVAEKKLTARVLGKQRSTSEIAQEVARLFDRRIQVGQAQGQQAAQVRQANKAQVSAQPATTTGPTGGIDQMEQLRDRARRGDIKAQEQLVKETLLADLNF